MDPMENKNFGWRRFFIYIKNENIKLTPKKRKRELIPWKILQSNTAEDGKRDMLSIFHRKEVLSNTPLELENVQFSGPEKHP